jgi:hypothetical protein
VTDIGLQMHNKKIRHQQNKKGVRLLLVENAREERSAKKVTNGQGKNHSGGGMQVNNRNVSHYYLLVVSGNAVHAALDENQAELGVLYSMQ